MSEELKTAILSGHHDTIMVALRTVSQAGSELAGAAAAELSLREGAPKASGIRLISTLNLLGGFVWAAVIVWGMSEQPSSYPQSAQFIDVMLMIVVIVSGVFSSMLFDALAEILERGRRNDWRAMKLFEVYVKLRQSEPTTQQTT